MALTVGELNAVLSVDDRTVAPALRRAEEAVRQAGQRMGADAERAGQQVGSDLGEGIVQGADGRLRNARGQFVAAGRRAGEAVGDGLTDTAADGADEAVAETESRLDRMKLVAAGIGLAAGALLMEGLNQALEQSQIAGRLGAQLGATPAEAQRYGKLAGKLYANAVTADFQSAADAISATMRAGIAPPQATEKQLESLATKVSDLSTTFELDLGQTANAVGQAIKTGLAKDGVEAIDVFTRGMQVMGPRADDLMDTFNEYSTIFRQTGIDAKTATGLLSQGMKAGARDTDVIADSIKEFVLITQGGGKEVDAAFKKIGLSGGAMQKAFVQGGPAARKALDQVFDRLRTIKDPADRAQIALTLFGTKAEDTQKALFALDPSSAVKALGDVGGSADKMGNTLRDNAGAKVEQFKRQAMQGLIDLLGTRVIPVLERVFNFVQKHSSSFKVAAVAVSAVLIPALTLLGVTATVTATRVVAGWVASGAAALRSAAVQVAAALRVAGSWAMMAARAVAAWTLMAARSVASAAIVAASWMGAALRGMITFAAQVLRTAAVAVAQFALMAARAIAWAAIMAAQWLIAMGPVGWIIAAVIALAALIIANWDKISAWTSQAWDWIWSKIQQVGQMIVNFFLNWTLPGLLIKHWDKIKSTAISMWNALVNWVKGIPGRIYNLFLNWTLPGLIIKHWQSIKTGVINKATEMVNWVRGLPGMIGRALGNLAGLLVDKGRDVVRGLWAGIRGMGGWLRGQLMSFARNMIPGPIARALGIASPSKVMAKEVGRWIPAGLVQGIESGAPAVDATMAGLVTPPRPAMAGAGGALSAASGGTRAGGPTVRIELSSSGSALDDWLMERLRKGIQVRGGNVQLVLGKT
ncbi:phage tail tape measure protein [Streptomyces sp. NPDC014779]|uniref:phage tail tape measure protein n=1 Tax=Streptomyces sp. NPDC014779 TaxID=3364911 RepID=UPI00370096F9